MASLAERNRFTVGLIGIAVVALLGILVVGLSRASLGQRTYTAILEHTGGLRVGEEVQVAGVGVGDVKAIALGEDGVEVTFTVDRDVRLGERTTAEVKVATLLGTHFLAVTPGGSRTLADGTIPQEQTRVPFNLQDVLDETVAEVEDLDAVVVEQAMAQLAETLDASGGELGPALDGVRRLSTLVAQRSDQLGELLGAADAVSSRLADSGEDIVALLKQADLILDTLRLRRDTIRALLTDLAELGTQLRGVVEDTRADMNPMLRDLNEVLDLLEDHEGDLTKTIRTLRPAARYFANASGTGPWLDQYVEGATPDNLECHVERHCG